MNVLHPLSSTNECPEGYIKCPSTSEELCNINCIPEKFTVDQCPINDIKIVQDAAASSLSEDFSTVDLFDGYKLAFSRQAEDRPITVTNSNDQKPCMNFEYLSSSQKGSHNDGHNLLFQTNEWGYIANNRRGELNSGYHG